MNTVLSLSGIATGTTPGEFVAQPPQACAPLDVACEAGNAIGAALQSLVTQLATGAADLVVGATTWWLLTPSVDPRDPAVLAAQGAIAPVATVILVMSVLVAAARMIISRRGEPLVTLAATIGRYALVSALGLLVLHGALLAGDALAADLLAQSAAQFGEFMRTQLVSNPENVLVSLLLSLVTAVLAIIQWLLMELRQASLLVLAAMLLLAAAGPKAWLYRLLGWLVAIVVYKPAAAFIYFIGFAYLTSAADGTGQIAALVAGVMVLALAVFAMPVLMRFFSWTGTQISGSGNGSGFLGAAGAVAMSQSYQQSHAVNRAQTMESTGPGSTDAAPTGSAPTSSGTGAATTSGSTGASGSAAGSGGSTAGGAGAAGGVAAVAGVAVQAAGRARDEMTSPPASTGTSGSDAPSTGSGRVAGGSVSAQSPPPARDQPTGGGRA